MHDGTARARIALAMLATASLFTGGCAPDAMTPRTEQAGYDGFLNLVATKCKPLMLGEHNISNEILYHEGLYDNQYDYFIDITSRVYYGQTSVAAYRGAVQSFFGEDPRTNRGIDCIVSNLPSAPPPMPAGPAKRIDQL